MNFIHSCEEMASAVEESVSDLIGKPEGGENTGMGADGTPTKKIDRVAEDCIIEYLSSSDLCGTLISEELGKAQIGDGEGTIFLDPIDGTHNAVAGIPFYALSVALAEDGIVQEGYVKDLAHNETFTAIKGKGAYLNGAPTHVSSTSLLKESAMSVYGQKFNPETIVSLGEKLRRWRLLGASAIELSYIGCGRLEGFIDVRGTLRVTDAAAGMLICEEGGGMVTDHQGNPITFPEEVTAGRSLVATNGVIHQKVIEYLR